MSIASEITRLQNAKAALKESIEAKGVTVEDSAKLDEYPELVDSIPSGGKSEYILEKDVNFYDYEGTRVYSYTKTEFLALENLPAHPDHTEDGLNADGCTYTLEDAKTYVTNNEKLDIGFLYYPTDRKNHLFIEITDYLKIELYIGSTQGIDIYFDWGDGTSNTYACNGVCYPSHTYNEPGLYNISFYSSINYCIVIGANNSSIIFNSKYYNNSSNKNAAKNRISAKKLYLDKVKLSSTMCNYTFIDTIIIGDVQIYSSSSNPFIWPMPLLHLNLRNLSIGQLAGGSDLGANIMKHMCLPRNITFSESNPILNFYSLKRLCCPITLNPFKVNNCYSLIYICIPEGITTISDSGLYNDYALPKVIIPSTITSIGNNAFKNDFGLTEVVVKSIIPPSLGSTAFDSTPTDLKIYVPAESVEEYKAATNWSNYADKIFAIPTE